MIHQSTFKFLKDIGDNNYKEWFADHRDSYEAAKKNLLAVTEQLIESIADFDDGVAKADLDPKKCLSRINRDMRFAKDKTPYKTEYFITIGAGTAAYYLVHVQPGGSYAGGGVFTTPPTELEKMRHAIEDSYDEWNDILNERSFKKLFPGELTTPDTLINVPRGFDKDSPAGEFLKMKGYFGKHRLTDAQMQDEKTFKVIIEAFQAAKPMVDFLNRATAKN